MAGRANPSKINAGVIRAPPPIPVRPTRTPTTNPRIEILKSISRLSQKDELTSPSMSAVSGVFFVSISPNSFCFLNLYDSTVVKGEDDRSIANRHKARTNSRRSSCSPPPPENSDGMLFLGMANIGKGSAIENVGGRVPDRKKNAE